MARNGITKVNEVETQIAELGQHTYSDLQQLWRRLLRYDPPPKLGRAVLELGIAWQLQARVLGHPNKSVTRRLDALARDADPNTTQSRPRRASLKPGTRLMRTWRGETYEVHVSDDGFVWRGKTWRSLSAIARAITGAQWSGPRFFGLIQADDVKEG